MKIGGVSNPGSIGAFFLVLAEIKLIPSSNLRELSKKVQRMQILFSCDGGENTRRAFAKRKTEVC